MRVTRSTSAVGSGANNMPRAKASSVSTLVHRFEAMFSSTESMSAKSKSATAMGEGAKFGDGPKYVSDSDLAAERMRSHDSSDSDYSHLSTGAASPQRTDSFTRMFGNRKRSTNASLLTTASAAQINAPEVTPRKHKAGSEPSLSAAITRSRESLYEAVSGSIYVVQQQPKKASGISRLAASFLRQLSGGPGSSNRVQAIERRHSPSGQRPVDADTVGPLVHAKDGGRRMAALAYSVPTARKVSLISEEVPMARTRSEPQQLVVPACTERYDHEVDLFEQEMLATVEAAFHTVEMRVPDTPDAMHSVHWNGCDSAKRAERAAAPWASHTAWDQVHRQQVSA